MENSTQRDSVIESPSSTKSNSASHISKKESVCSSNGAEVQNASECHLPIVRPNMPLWECIETLDRMGRGLLELTGDEMRDLGTVTKSKVDGYKQFTDMAGAVGEMIGRWEDELAQARKTLESKVNGLKSHMQQLMTTFGLEKLPGHVYKAWLQKSPPRLVMCPEYSKPDVALFTKFPSYMKITYSWDNDAVKKAIQAGETQFSEFATVEQGTSLRFGVNKEV